MNSGEYLEIRLPVKNANRDILSGLLFLWGCMGIRELENGKWLVYFPAHWTTDKINSMVKALQRVNPAWKADGLRISRIPVRDWDREWRKFFKPFEAVSGIWVRPPWIELPGHTKGIEILIQPQMAFGTGQHESTRLVMKALASYSPMSKTVLDVGTGSGILAILARKLGANFVLGIDIDPLAIANAHHNISLNKLNGIGLAVGDIRTIGTKPFELILVNITLNVLLQICEDITRLVTHLGKIILSGILREDRMNLIPAYEKQGMHLIDEYFLNNWTCLVMEKHP